jgi:hypothetical protein
MAVLSGLGGKVVVTGIGKSDDDEFMLNLLNEQVVLIFELSYHPFLIFS